MSDYTSTYVYSKIDGVDVVEADDFNDLGTEFSAIEAASATKADKTGDTVSFIGLTVSTSVTFAGATVADLGAVTTADLNGGTLAGMTVDGSLTWSAAQDFNSQILTNVNIDSGDISAATISGGLTWSAAQDLNSQILTNVNIDSGDISAATISGALTWSTAQDSVTLTTVDINSGAIDGTPIGAASASTAEFTALDWDRSTWTRIASAQSPYTASVGERIFCDCDGPIEIDLPASPATDDTIWIRVSKDCDTTNTVTLDPGLGDSIGGQAANDTLLVDLAFANLELVANASDNWDF